ncbi:metallophosphatase [Mesorhizobium sp. M1C.F.Ca.ET.193.01.1.1]|uniref:CapA family protein n=1 Tax=unclassified Mesorhizobium TaxID=325217 RepID=UPI000FD43611|nr:MULTISPECIES: CapA family protein [unclassified Mesorhizobium]TGT02144.1 metallophosphatase [bacterium M00.F.Ca.ET.177.01.1.1]TGQ54396.1 metallophosphatase [Mesorhizobium sp. M1C.F.Ca.ET.210.01.1.1]TGQ72392.1 metallophosphatase [Mesorhizobium sp. M1C.F.Ca.ET.212.01.1.1]TGR10188.1 metallophosphatase [Mesorhizobium sp. M1C.F.Ca.ET.204.01.1.1]TGR30791.1 metallophosphatase [Mesorhizobium sp. M1C.F.Ca.ET.196.01.1.1]
MSNYPLSYKLLWLPRFLKPSLGGDGKGFAAPAATLMEPPPAQRVRLAFIGDTSAVANRAAPECDPTIATLLGSADLVIGNCESPIVERPSAVAGTRFGTHHAMTERFLADALTAVGVAREKLVLSLANNHVLDQGVAGFEETVAALKRLGIRTIGTSAGGSVQRHAAGPLTIGFAAFTLWRNADEAEFRARVSMDPPDTQREAVPGTDLLCAVPHWDWEFRHFPRPATRALARRLASHGVGLITGHHAHVVQPVERIGGTLIAYGLGDFLGTAFARQPWPGRIGSILIVDVSADAATRGTIAGYRLHFFMRLAKGGHERLVPVESLDGAIGQRVVTRLDAIFPDQEG